MIPIHLSIAGFLSYRDPVELDFTHFDLACISGPNGAGKSSLLDAITFALFGQARNRGDALINTAKDVSAAQVALTFSYEGNVYRVTRIAPREKNTLLEFHIQTGENKWKALTERTLRDTDALILATLRLDYETFINASFFLQGKADQFTQQRPADRKRILSSILGLEIWEEYRQRAAARRKTVEDEMALLQGRLHEIAKELDEESVRKTRLEELRAQLKTHSETRAAQEALLEDLRSRAGAVEQQRLLAATLATQLERTQAQLTELRSRHEERSAEQAGFADLENRASEIEAIYTGWQAQRKELTRLDEIASQFHQQELKRSRALNLIEAEQARLETELKSLQTEQANLQTLLASKTSLQNELETLETEIARSEAQLAKRAEWEAELAHGREAVSAGNAQNEVFKVEMEAIKGKIDQMKAAEGLAACPTCGQELTEAHRLSVIDGLTKEGTEKGDAFRANRSKRDQLQQRVVKLEKDLAALDQLEANFQSKNVRAGQVRSRIVEITQVETDWGKRNALRITEIEAALELETYSPEARAELAQIDAELKALGYDTAQHDALRRQELTARSSEDQMRLLEQARATAKPLEREIKDLRKQIAAQEKDLTAQEAAYAQAAETLEPLAAGLPDVQTVERTMLDTQERENQARQAVGAAQQEVAVLDTLRTRRIDLEAQREVLAGKVSELQSLERAFGKDGVPAMLIEQALPQIETKANQILDRLSAGAMSIHFVTQLKYKDSKRGDLRETLEIQISDGAGIRDYEMFSGGEAFRINFAIRLALSEVLAQRAGARLQTLVIDEGFGSQDEAGIQRLVEVISLIRQDFAKILVITHLESLKDAFPNRIEVEKGPRGSMVTVV